MAWKFCIKLFILYTINLQVVKQKGSHKIVTAFILANKRFNLVNLFLKKHPESDAGAFNRSSNNFAVCHYRFAGAWEMKFYGDLLADEQALPGVNKNTARTDIVNGRLKVALHGPAICNQQADSVDFFTSIFSSF